MENLTGKTIGKYKLESLVGEGGMASVYKAYRRDQDRYVALKILPRHFSENAQFVSRFKREARVLSELQHPHILWVSDFGEAEGYTYMAMPLLTGGSLARRMMTASMPLEDVARVVKQVGAALDYAHQRNMVHRDLKPGNILIDAAGNYLLADFGIAKLYDANTHLTREGMQLGTPAYMSPEQIQGILELDGRSDLYSFGVVLYEIVTGRVPFSAPTAMTVMFMQVSNPPPEPRTFNPTIPLALEAVILKALAKAPDDRYASMPEFVAAFEAAVPLPQRPAVVLRPPPPNPATRPPTPLPKNPTPPPVTAPPVPAAVLGQPTHITPPPAPQAVLGPPTHITPPPVAPPPVARHPTPPPVAPPTHITPPPVSLPPPAPLPRAAEPRAKTPPLWLMLGGGVVGLVVLGLICSSLWTVMAAPAPTDTLPPPTTVRPSATRTAANATTTPTLTPAPATATLLHPIPTSAPSIGEQYDGQGALMDEVYLGKAVQATTNGELTWVKLPYAPDNAARFYLQGVGGRLEIDALAAPTLQTTLFNGDVLFLPSLFSGTVQLGAVTALANGENTCLGATLTSEGEAVTLRCFSGNCYYDLGTGPTQLSADKYIVITNTTTFSAPRNIPSPDRSTYRALLTQGGKLLEADLALCRLNPTVVPQQPTNTPQPSGGGGINPTVPPPTAAPPPTDPPKDGVVAPIRPSANKERSAVSV